MAPAAPTSPTPPQDPPPENPTAPTSAPTWTPLASKHCKPCEGGVGKLDAQSIAQYSGSTPDWKVDGEKLRRTFVFRHFRAAMAFLNRVADLAESEGHHPDFCVHYNRVEFSIWTHAVGGLSENDFILAAKISELELRTG